MAEPAAARLATRLAVVAGFVSLVWAVSLTGLAFDSLVSASALIPRDLGQWWGIWTTVLVHSDLSHLLANSAPLVVFLLLLQTKGARHLYLTLPLCVTLSGLLLWCFGRHGAHIGASGLVFALFACHVADAFFMRGWLDILVSAAVLIGYGWLVFGVLPSDPGVSWEGHLLGAIAGVLSSWIASREPSQTRLT